MRLTILFAGVAFAVGAAEMPKCPLSGEWVLDADVSDEFDGPTLDKTKWWDYAPHLPGRPGAYRWHRAK